MDLANYNFTIQYIKGVDNRLADWLSRPGIKFTEADQGDSKPAGKFCQLENSKLLVYIPSWCCPTDTKGKKLENLEIGADYAMTAYFAAENDIINSGLSTFLCRPDPEKRSTEITKFLSLADAQITDTACSMAISALESRCPSKKSDLFKKLSNLECDFSKSLVKNRTKLHVDPGSRLLTLVTDQKVQMVVPPSYIAKLLRSAHTVHLGGARTTEKLEHFWWPQKAVDIADFVRTCVTCAKQKGR